MRYLVDTHILLWSISGSKRLKNSVKDILVDSSNQVYVSVVSGLEIAIKKRTGKIRLKTSLKECFKKSGFSLLDVNLSHALELDRLPIHHNDPFDRILISQAKVENLTLITADKKIWRYKVPVLKA